jgi:type I restriction enzyme S subunit
LPPRETLERFDDFVKPITSFILVTAKRNQALGTTRDLLLPKLISGEIPVEAADEAAAELAEQSV